jgi:hypothetical protein
LPWCRGPEGVIGAAVEALYHPVGLQVVCCCLGVLDVKLVAQGGPQEWVNWAPRSDVINAGTPNLLTLP